MTARGKMQGWQQATGPCAGRRSTRAWTRQLSKHPPHLMSSPLLASLYRARCRRSMLARCHPPPRGQRQATSPPSPSPLRQRLTPSTRCRIGEVGERCAVQPAAQRCLMCHAASQPVPSRPPFLCSCRCLVPALQRRLPSSSRTASMCLRHARHGRVLRKWLRLQQSRLAASASTRTLSL